MTAAELADRLAFMAFSSGSTDPTTLLRQQDVVALITSFVESPAGIAPLQAIIQRRLAQYKTDGAPWHGWPISKHGSELALLILGIDDQDESDALLEEYLAGIKDKMIRAGFSEATAEDWTCEIAAESGCQEADLEFRGCNLSQIGRA